MRKICALFALALLLNSCARGVVVDPRPKPTAKQAAKPAPPGQVKKVTGGQSAKPYAPGQQKKKQH